VRCGSESKDRAAGTLGQHKALLSGKSWDVRMHQVRARAAVHQRHSRVTHLAGIDLAVVVVNSDLDLSGPQRQVQLAVVDHQPERELD